MKAKKRTNVASGLEGLYQFVGRLLACPDEKSVLRTVYSTRDPRMKKALGIFRHLRALEDDILTAGQACVTFGKSGESDRTSVTIVSPTFHCSRVAYLSAREMALLMRNRRVSRAVRQCKAVA